jgi:hypothetical protein
LDVKAMNFLLYVVRADGSQRWSLPSPKLDSFSIFLGANALSAVGC